MMKKLVYILTAVVLCCALLIGLFAVQTQEYRIADRNKDNFNTLLSDLLDTYETADLVNRDKVKADLEAIATINSRDYAVAKSIADHWAKVYLDPDYHLNLWPGNAEQLEFEQTGIPNKASHAFVVLGYELKDGEMTDELKGRCEAAAAAANVFSHTILVCSGGATGANNPEGHTEAGMMKAYLVENCGISSERIFTDEKAMTTAENAVNTFAILKEHGIRTMTIVTSSYHQRWGQVLYNAVSALYEQQFGYAPEIISNYCYDIGPENSAYRNDAEIAIRQLSSILGVSRYAARSS